jgi:hypothetical protein
MVQRVHYKKEGVMTHLGMQILAHFVGDYMLQSNWMANNKTKHWWPALVHASTYFVPFYFLCHPSLLASVVIVGTHFAIDHWRLARYVIYTKDYLAPKSAWKPWAECNATGYHESVPPFLAVWLMIINDNLLHVIINALALAYL